MSRKGCPNKISRKIRTACGGCGNDFMVYPSRLKVGGGKYCSISCASMSPERISKLVERSMGNKWGELRKITEGLRKKLSLASKGKIRPKISAGKFGNKNPNWKGGTSPEHKRIRRSSKFFEWRKRIFERDDYTCRECNVRGGILHPHHIKPFATFRELRFDINNGITLCKECHMKTETWSFSWCKKHPLPKIQK